MVPILQVWMTAFFGLVMFGAAGLAATAFLPQKRVSMMAAPLAGIALWPLATLGLYTGIPPGFGVGFDSAARLAWAALAPVGCLLTWWNGSLLGTAWRSLVVAAIASMIIAPIVMIASIDRGEPALLWVDGGGHLAYASMADWFRSHPPQMITEGPLGEMLVGPAVADRTQPYINWAELLLTADVRGGAFAYLALVSMLSGQSAAFSFNAAVAIALIAACFGCAAVFSRSWIFLLCLAAALLTGVWYDYGLSGFLGKLLAYPLALFSFGVFVAFCRANVGPAEVLALAMIASGAALMHNAVSYGLLFICLAAPFLLAAGVIERRLPSVAHCALAVFPPVAALIASGTLARPFNALRYPDYAVPWAKIAGLVTDLISLGPVVPLAPRPALFVMFFVCVVAAGVLIAFAAVGRNAAALALLCGPAAFVLAVYALNQPAIAVQVAGFPYAAALCAAFLVVQQGEQSGWPRAGPRYVLLTTLVALVLVHIPRVTSTVIHYVRDSDRKQMFAASDFERLRAAIGDREVYVDIRGNIRTVLPIMVELGRRNVKLAWSADSWYFAGSFRGDPTPPIEKMPSLRLIDATEQARAGEQIIVETRRYKLFGPAKAAVD